jgi:ABC-type lipoprotein export system ATPase subunit
MRRELDGLGLGEVDLEAEAARLSVGQTARVSLIRTLLTAPGCLLLDEPCAALDPDASELVFERINAFTESGGAVVMAGHGSPVRDSRVVRLEGGRLIEEVA